MSDLLHMFQLPGRWAHNHLKLAQAHQTLGTFPLCSLALVGICGAIRSCKTTASGTKTSAEGSESST